MIILPILTTSLIHLWECNFWAWEWQGSFPLTLWSVVFETFSHSQHWWQVKPQMNSLKQWSDETGIISLVSIFEWTAWFQKVSISHHTEPIILMGLAGSTKPCLTVWGQQVSLFGHLPDRQVWLTKIFMGHFTGLAQNRVRQVELKCRLAQTASPDFDFCQTLVGEREGCQLSTQCWRGGGESNLYV